MDGVESATSAPGMVCAVLGGGRFAPTSGTFCGDRATETRRSHEGEVESLPEEGALASARGEIMQALNNCGFINVVGGFLDNFKMLLEGGQVHGDLDDLELAWRDDFAAWVAQRIADKADRSLKAQAHVRPEAALKLLT